MSPRVLSPDELAELERRDGSFAMGYVAGRLDEAGLAGTFRVAGYGRRRDLAGVNVYVDPLVVDQAAELVERFVDVVEDAGGDLHAARVHHGDDTPAVRILVGDELIARLRPSSGRPIRHVGQPAKPAEAGQ